MSLYIVCFLYLRAASAPYETQYGTLYGVRAIIKLMQMAQSRANRLNNSKKCESAALNAPDSCFVTDPAPLQHLQ